MEKTLLPYSLAPQLAKTDVAYATHDPALRQFYAYEPNVGSFGQLIADKSKSALYQTGSDHRKTLVEALRKQYDGLGDLLEYGDPYPNIDALLDGNTFTVTTAHQPSLFLGPLYYIYKALTTINLADEINLTQKGKYKVVPVFVLGSEDHDLEELNHVRVFGKKIEWQPGEKGAVGQMGTASMEPVLKELEGILGNSDAANTVMGILKRAYNGKNTVAEATQTMLHVLFGKYGLIVLNMSDAGLKKRFVPFLKSELTEQVSSKLVSDTIAQLNAVGFKSQAAPREINLFYLMPGMRERIILENGMYKVNNSEIKFTVEEMLSELNAHPERFSPNVVLRPLYQEFILPNLAYIGGGGELAYWLERKPLFEHYGVNFPMLVRRNSVLWLDADSWKKIQKLGFTPQQFFGDTDALIRSFVSENSEAAVDLQEEQREMKKIFDQLAQKAQAVDATLEKAVRADEVKFMAAIGHWQDRLVRAEKAKHEVSINQLRTLKEKLFPNNGLQERSDNFIPYYMKHGSGFIEELKNHLHPFEEGFVILFP